MQSWSWEKYKASICPDALNYVLGLAQTRRLDLEDEGAVRAAVRWMERSPSSAPRAAATELRHEPPTARPKRARESFFAHYERYETLARLVTKRHRIEAVRARLLTMGAPTSPVVNLPGKGHPPKNHELYEAVECSRLPDGSLPFGREWKKKLSADKIAAQKAAGRGFGFWENFRRQWIAAHPEDRKLSADTLRRSYEVAKRDLEGAADSIYYDATSPDMSPGHVRVPSRRPNKRAPLTRRAVFEAAGATEFEAEVVDAYLGLKPTDEEERQNIARQSFMANDPDWRSTAGAVRVPKEIVQKAEGDKRRMFELLQADTAAKSQNMRR